MAARFDESDRARFMSTSWTLVREASREVDAFRRLVELYRPPIVNFIARQGRAQDAEDLAQEVLIRISRPEFLRRVDPSKGRFRTLLLRVTQRTVVDAARLARARKRRGSNPLLSLDQLREEASRAEPASPEDDSFDREWCRNLIRLAAKRWMEECEARRSLVYRMFHEFHFDGRSQEEVSRSNGKSIQDVKNAVFQTKAKLREYVLDLIRDYAQEDAPSEIRTLARWLPLPSEPA